jgi:hypothetical protein
MEPPLYTRMLDDRGLVTREWHRFFLLLAGEADSNVDAITGLIGDVVASGPGVVTATIPNGTITNPKLATMPAGSVKGRNFDTPGEVEDLLLSSDDFRTEDGTLYVNGGALGGYWSILANGDPVTPEVVFDGDGDVIAVWVPD